MVLQRYLEGIEIQVGNRGWLRAAEYEGEINEEVFERAIELLCIQYPVLRARVCRDNHGYLLHVPSDHHPGLEVFDGDESTLWRETYQPWDFERSVVRFVLIRGRGRGFAGLRVDHAIVDGASLAVIFEELWRLYTEIIRHSEASVRPGVSLPRSPYELLNQRWGQIHEPPRDPVPTRHEQNTCDSIVQYVRLSEGETSRLLSNARAHEVSVHGLVCGGILVALRSLGTPTESLPMACRSGVNLRNKVNPSVGPTETTNFVTWHLATVAVTRDVSPADVGRQIKQQLDASFERRDLSIDATMPTSAVVDATSKPYLSYISVTNPGVLPSIPQPAGLTITNVISQTPQRVPAKPSYGSWYRVRTFERRLTLDCVYPSAFFTPEEVDQHVKRIKAQLCRPASSLSLT